MKLWKKLTDAQLYGSTTVPKNSTLNFKTGSHLQDNGLAVDVTQFSGITAGTAAASKAVVLSSTKGITGLGAVTSTSATGGIGYAAGAGGTVTQATSKSTEVTLNTVSGQITMNAAALAAATIVSFTLTDSAIGANDVLVLNHVSGGTPGSYTLNARAAAGSATIDVRNNTTGSLSEAIVIGFAVIKGAVA